MQRVVWRLTGWGLLGTLLVGGPAQAQQRGASEAPGRSAEAAERASSGANPGEAIAWKRREQEARRHFLAGRDAYREGRYESALRHFEKSYELSGRPGLLWNIATAADRLRRTDRAIEAFELFLAAQPDSELRPQVEARLRVLREERSRLRWQQEQERQREAEVRRLREEVRRKEAEARERERRLREEEMRRLREERERAALAQAPPKAEREGGSTWVWFGVGLGAAAVAGGVVAAVLLSQGEAGPAVHPDVTLAALR